jgi:hypothetical protein
MKTAQFNLDEILEKAEELKREHSAESFIIRYADLDNEVFYYASSYLKPMQVNSYKELISRSTNLLTTAGKFVLINAFFASNEFSYQSNLITNKLLTV